MFYIRSTSIKLVLIFLLLLKIIPADSQEIRFRHIAEKEGLKYTWVWHLFKDSEGFIWCSTQEGAFRYDGIGFRHFNDEGENGLPTDRVNFVYEDPNGYLWFGTRKGLSRFDREHESFKHYNKQTNKAIASNNILCMEEGPKGDLWIGTDHGLSIYKNSNDSLISLNELNKVYPVYHNFPVTDLLKDSKGKMWIAGLSNKIRQYDPVTNEFKTFTLLESPGHRVSKLFEDSRGFLWIALNGGGLIQFNPVSGKTENRYTTVNGLSNNEVRDIVEDNSGRIWVGTENGLTIFNPHENRFFSVQTNASHSYGLSDNAIYSLLKEENGDIWVGTFFGGLNVWHNRYKQFQCYVADGTNTSVTGDAISDIYSHGNKLWIGTEDHGFSVFNTNTKEFQHFTSDNSNLSYNNVHSIFLDSKKNLWVGTYTGGLNLLRPGKDNFEVFPMNRNQDGSSVRGNSVYSIFEDNRNVLWLGTRRNGLFWYNSKTKSMVSAFPDMLNNLFIWDIMQDHLGQIWLAAYGNGVYVFPSNRSSTPKRIDLPASNILNLYQDKSKRIWVGTEKEGLFILNPEGEILHHLSQKEGLPDNTIYDVIQDDEGKIWLTTNYGLCSMTPSLKSLDTYTVSDGLPTNRFNYNSVAKHEGKLYFGTTRGLVVVDPTFEYKDKSLPSVYLSSFYLFNKEIDVQSDGSLLKKPVNYVKTITLNSEQNSFSIDYTAPTYWNSDKIMYAYKLDGLDKSWNFVGNKRKATYTNLDPGHYSFGVRTVSENNQLSRNEKRLTVVIHPPWYRTWWAYILFITSLLTIGFVIVHSLLSKTKAEHALEIEKLAKEKITEMNDMKIKFFTNISHEFKNPLSLISGPVNQLLSLKEVPVKRKNWYYSLIKKNADRMLLLLNELLEFKNVQDEHLTLKTENVSPHELIEDLMSNFSWLAEDKKINFTYQSNSVIALLPLDVIKFEKILSNILSNAFKFTPSHGYVTIESEVEADYFKISVRNSGKGIQKKNLSKVFDRYFKEGMENLSDSGIGLAYVKSLIELHRGRISVNSLPGVETSFILEFPIHSHFYQLPSLLNNSPESLEANIPYLMSDLEKYYPVEKPSILIVDDSKDIRDFLQESLSDNFSTSVAKNGLEAYQAAQSSPPDILISDILMPKMNGYELCGKIKNNLLTSHTRVILLTALSESKEKLSGYKSGADAYISKPFNIELINSRIINLLISSNILKSNFQNNIDQPPIELANSNPDEKLLTLAIETVHKHLDDPEFNLDKFAEEVGLSKTTLYRKLKALTGQSTNEFILSIRLKQAAKLVKETPKRIAEISYDVGFSDPYYFSRAFKKTFGLSPKQFREYRSINL